MLSKLDETLMRWVNDGYLWLLDRTGVYVASVGVAANVVYVAWIVIVRGKPFDWFDGLFLTLMALWGIVKWTQQHMGMITEFNEDVLVWRESRWRKWGAMLLLVLYAPSLLGYGGGWRMFVGVIFYFLASYTWCILIRDREPKEFWAQAPKLATEKLR